MKQTSFLVLTALGFLGATVAYERSAAACGGCFHETGENNTIVTDHRMVFSISQQQTTLFDQIKYQGSPGSFAWVLPIKGTATVGVSSDAVFATLDPVTGVQVFPPPTNCPPPPDCGGVDGGALSSGADAGASGGGVDVLAEATVGPYETVQLHSSDPNALSTWLAGHGYSIPAAIAPIVSAYVSEGFDFLAVKLVPGKSVSAMVPIRVTTPGASTNLPLRMVSAGTGASVGITLWVIGDGRWESQNFPNFTIAADDVSWDWSMSQSTYAQVRAQRTAALGGVAWQNESSTNLNVGQLESQIRFASRGFDPTTGKQTDEYAQTSSGPVDAGAADASSSDGGDEGGTPDAGPPVDADTAFQNDMNALFGNSNSAQVLRITRMRSDLPHASLTADLVIQASADQSELPTQLFLTKEIGQPQCPVYDNQCQVTGMAPRDQATADANNRSSGGGCATARRDAGSLSWEELFAFGAVAFVFARSRKKSAQKRSISR